MPSRPLHLVRLVYNEQVIPLPGCDASPVRVGMGFLAFGFLLLFCCVLGLLLGYAHPKFLLGVWEWVFRQLDIFYYRGAMSWACWGGAGAWGQMGCIGWCCIGCVFRPSMLFASPHEKLLEPLPDLKNSCGCCVQDGGELDCDLDSFLALTGACFVSVCV